MQDFIAFCTLMACLIVLCASIIALIKPLPKFRLGTRRRALGGLGVAFGLFILTAIVIPQPKGNSAADTKGRAFVQSTQAAEGPQKVEQKSAAQTVKAVATLPLTLGQFSERYNQLSAGLGKDWRIHDVKIINGSFTYMINDNIGISGGIAGDGHLTNLSMIGTGDGTQMSGLNVFGNIAAIYCAVSGLDHLSDCGKPVLKFVGSFKDGGEPVHAVLNNVKFSYLRNDVMGNVFSAEPL